jgi:penicillin-binding protein 1A
VVKNPQLFIGNLAGNPRELASAFTIFPNDGKRRRPFLIHKITDKAGNVLFDASIIEVDVVSPGVAHIMRRILGQVMDKGTAASVRSQHGFKEPGGGKTGTTNDYKDAWFAGYTDRITCAVWVGLDKPETIIDEGYGSRMSIPIWADVAKKAVELGYIPAGPRAEPPLTKVALCRTSSQLATPGCQSVGAAYEDELPYELVPQGFCEAHNGMIAQPSSAPRASGPRGLGLFDRIRGWFR